VSIVTLQVIVLPEHAPDQDAKVEFASGVAVRFTGVFSEKLALHVTPQSVPVGLLLTVPPPAPVLETVKVYDGEGSASNRAVTVFGPFISTVQVLTVPLQSPPHSINFEVESVGFAVKSTDLPDS